MRISSSTSQWSAPVLQWILRGRPRGQDSPTWRLSSGRSASVKAHFPLPKPYLRWSCRYAGPWAPSDTQVLINAMGVRRVDLQDNMPTSRACHRRRPRNGTPTLLLLRATTCALSASDTISVDKGWYRRRRKSHPGRHPSDELGAMTGIWRRESPKASARGRPLVP